VAKDSSRIIDGELQRLVDSWGQKAYNYISIFFFLIKQLLHQHMLFVRVSRKIFLAHPKTNNMDL